MSFDLIGNNCVLCGPGLPCVGHDLKQPDDRVIAPSITADSTWKPTTCECGHEGLHVNDHACIKWLTAERDQLQAEITALQQREQVNLEQYEQSQARVKDHEHILQLAKGEIAGLQARVKELEADRLTMHEASVKLEAALAEKDTELKWFRVHYSALSICGHHETDQEEAEDGTCVYCQLAEKDRQIAAYKLFEARVIEDAGEAWTDDRKKISALESALKTAQEALASKVFARCSGCGSQFWRESEELVTCCDSATVSTVTFQSILKERAALKIAQEELASEKRAKEQTVQHCQNANAQLLSQLTEIFTAFGVKEQHEVFIERERLESELASVRQQLERCKPFFELLEQNTRLANALKLAAEALMVLIPSTRSPLAKCWCPHYIDVTQGHSKECLLANKAIAEAQKEKA